MELRHYRLPDLEQARPVLSRVYAEVYGDKLADEFHTLEKFEQRLRGHTAGDDWEAVIAWDTGEPVGFVYAAPLRPGARWWSVMREALPEAYTMETGSRTLALFELMVRDQWRGSGLSEELHEELLRARSEERVTLLVDPSHPKVLDLYVSWGYKRIGDQQPFPDAPVYAVMVRTLR
ncbi:GNAT family N-acetyltransferase [Streptodolium elevatio]|uniref:GNAT family N-acetyltransferase n=1 Tax=Streptodolium elevatio TaxID=3157996 RepID=A0ABV3DBM9_9ACTN